MKLMKGVDEDDEFSGFDDECDEFLDLMMNFNVFWQKLTAKIYLANRIS